MTFVRNILFDTTSTNGKVYVRWKNSDQFHIPSN